MSKRRRKDPRLPLVLDGCIPPDFEKPERPVEVKNAVLPRRHNTHISALIHATMVAQPTLFDQ